MNIIHYPKTSHRFHRKQLLFICSFLCNLALQAQVYYVKPGAVGSGASWAAAGDLQTVINAAAAGSQVWVAAGTYNPNAYPPGSSGGSGNRDYSFALKNGVTVYGGFVGTETLLSQRNPVTHVTILSGDVNTLGTYTDDCYHVVLAVGNNNTAGLDGFTVKYGYANGGGNINYGGQSINQGFGGGILCYNASPTIENCIFSNNLAVSGGAIYNRNSGVAPVFGSCTFSANNATSGTDGGGAALCYSSSSLTFDTCTFNNNKATGQDGGVAFGNSGSVFIFDHCTMTSNTASANGGAIYANSGTINLITCTFTTNTAAGSGGAVASVSSTKLTATNSAFTGNIANSASVGGGAIYCNSTNGSTASNCTFTGNKATTYGGAYYGINGAGGLVMSYCTFTSNLAAYGAGMANTGGSAPTVNNCTFSNGSATYGGAVYNLNGSPAFTVDSFLNNTATATSGMAGGGMLNDAGSNTVVSHCWFHGNVTNGGDGAGQYNNGTSGLDSSCVFEANLAKGAASNGGGAYMNGGNSKFYNCVFVDNGSKTNGGGYYNNASNTTVENCTFYNNSAPAGAGLYDAGGGNPSYYANMVWGNNPDGLALGAGASSGFHVSYNNFQAAYTGGGSTAGNTFAAPVFFNSGSYVGSDGKWATFDDGLHLITASAGRDAVLISAGVNMPDDITMGPRPDAAGELYADEGAYENMGAYLLPQQLLQFTAAQMPSTAVLLQWQVDAATQARVYEIQKSLNGTDFTTIARINAASGEQAYQYTDLHAGSGALYYRLRLDGDEKESYSGIAVIRNDRFAGRFTLLSSLINGPSASLLVSGAGAAGNLSVTVTDVLGRIQLRNTLPIGQGDSKTLLDVSPLARGVYFLCITAAGGVQRVLPFEKL